MKRHLLIFGAAITMISCGPKQQSSTKTVTATPADPTEYASTITADELKEMLYIYASDEFEGRETGKPGQKKAVEYIKKHYVDLGVPTPLGNDDYFQEVPLEVQKTPKVSMYVNGKEFAYFDDFISLNSANNGKFEASEVVYIGYGIADDKYSDYDGIDVKGKIVVAKAGEPKNEDGTFIISGDTKGSKWSNGRQSISAKRDAARDNGAKALFLMDNNMFPRYSNFFKNMASSGRGNRLSLKDPNADNMYFFLTNESIAKALVSNINDNDNAEIVNSAVRIGYENVADAMISENVIAYIKGSEKADEYIVISSHLDHVGVNNNGDVYNGADDDGSGTVAMLEIAEAFKKAAANGHRPKRSIVFLHVTGEEKGLLGSRYYTDIDPVFPLAQTVANLNIDMIGRTDPKREGKRNYLYLIGSDKLSTELHNLSEEVNNKYTNIEFDYTYNDENDPNRFYYRSDHYNFAKNNIPIIFYFNGTHEDYHQPGDTPDKIEYDLLENRTKLVFYTAWELANRDKRIIADKAETTH